MRQSATVATSTHFQWQEESTGAVTAIATGILSGQCQGPGRQLLRRLAEQGEHTRKCREPVRGLPDESSSRNDRRVDDGLKSQQAQRKGPHRPAHSVFRKPVRSQRKTQQHGENTGALLQRAERKVNFELIFHKFVQFY